MTLLFLLILQVRTKTRPKHHFTKTASFLFSSNSSSFYLKDLKNQPQQQQQQPSHSEPSTASFTSSKQQRSSLDEVRRNHSLFRRSTADTSPLQDKKPVSFQELYGRSVLQKPLEPAGDSGSGNAGRGERYSLNSVRVSLNNIIAVRSGGRRGVDPISLSDYKEALRLRPEDSYSAASSQEKVIGARGDEGVAGDRRRTGPISLTDFKATLRLRPSDPSSATAALSPEKAIDMRGAGGFSGYRREIDPMQEYKDALSWRPPDSWSASAAPTPEKLIRGTSISQGSVFGREMRKKIDRDGSSAASRSGFVRVYGYGELGEKLRKLRPEVKGRGKKWFSIGELNERLMRLRENEEKEDVMSECLVLVNEINNENSRKSSLQKSDIISQLGRTPSYILDPPKEHLFEKYFHPDNMSSEEKLKIELAKVREVFKMSESDCGSACVQVAQLTTKIKHLSAVLHKKDLHSRKGLVAMVQRRKRLLKYLRRTDWDSYCFVISKLGLRDNPDHSLKTHKTGRTRQATYS